MKFLHLTVLALAIGCGPKHVTFYPTSSPCVDSIFANFSYAKCKSIEQKIDSELSGGQTPMLVFSCIDPSVETIWTDRSFYVIKNIPNSYISDNLIPVCMDINSMIFIDINSGQ